MFMMLLFMFVMRLMFAKFAHIILIHWCVILILCKINCEQHGSNMQKSLENM